MNSLQLEQILERDEFTKTKKCFVIARDIFINKNIPAPSFIICNTDNSDGTGIHWFVVYYEDYNHVELFDSFALLSIDETLMNKIISLAPNMTYNDTVIQGSNSSVCGQYCIIFLLLRSRGHSFHQIIRWLLHCKNIEQRDHTVNEIINQRYNHLLEIPLYPHDFTFIDDSMMTYKTCEL